MPSPIVKKLEAKLADLDSKLEGAAKGKDGNVKTPSKEEVFGAPAARKGESAMTSRGFQFQRLLGVMTKTIQPEHAKVEMDVVERLREHNMAHDGWKPTPGAVSAPLATDFMGHTIDDGFRHEMKALCAAGVTGYDPQEAMAIARKAYGLKTNQSWLDETLGGALVAPAEMGELIQLLRNKDALINAGARVVPLPSSGRLKYPRQTSASTGYWVGENAATTGSNVGTGSLILSAKKVAALITLPNELIRFASPASEAILRADMTKTLSLTMDKGLLEGEGSDNTPLGLINTPNIATVTPTTVATDGNTLAPQDLFKFISAVEENNAEFQGWILRPSLFWQFVQARAGVYNGSTTAAQGQFVYDQMRQLGQGFGKVLGGYPAVTTPQVSITRSKGSGNNLTYVVGGQWDDFVIAMFGSVEFAQANQGDTAFANDQTVVRAILTCDGAARHPGAFAIADQLLQSVSA